MNAKEEVQFDVLVTLSKASDRCRIVENVARVNNVAAGSHVVSCVSLANIPREWHVWVSSGERVDRLTV